MLRTILILIYFGINLLLIGISLGLNNNGLPSKKETFIYIIMLFIALPFTILVYIWDYWLTPLFKALQIKFFWQFFFTDKWKSCSEAVLQNLNRFMYNQTMMKKSLKNRIYRHSLNLVFKRNNFEPVEYKTGLEWLETIPKTFQVKVITPDAWYNEEDFIKTRITKKQFVQNMKTSAISHTIIFELDKF